MIKPSQWKRYYVLQYTCIDSMIVLMLTLVLYVIRYSMFVYTYFLRASLVNVCPLDNCLSGVRNSVKQLDLHKNGTIDADLVGVHSLRAGGAMALKLLPGEADRTIQTYGRWSWTTLFLDYIHNQIAHLSKSISTKISTQFIFTNIANIKQPPDDQPRQWGRAYTSSVAPHEMVTCLHPQENQARVWYKNFCSDLPLS